MTMKKNPSNKNDRKSAEDAPHSAFDDVTAHVKAAARQAGQNLHGYADSAHDHLEEIYADLEDGIRKEPLKAVAIAMGIGFLAGLLSRR